MPLSNPLTRFVAMCGQAPNTSSVRFRAFSIALVFLLVAAVLPIRQAKAQVGGASVLFLMIEPDSRAAGMGNASVAVADNANAIFWNPAGLAYQRGTEAGITHSTWLPELNAGLYYEYFVAKHHFQDIGTLGMHITYLNLGEHERRDENNVRIGDFKSHDLSVGASYGMMLTDHFSLGVGTRFIYSDLASGVEVGGQSVKPGISVGVDIGGLYRMAPFQLGGVDTEFSAGFNVANMGPTITYVDDEQADPIPMNARFGYSFKFDLDEYNSITFANDFTKLLTDFDDNRDPVPAWKSLFTSWQSIDVDLTANNDTTDLVTLSVLDQLMVGLGTEYWYNQLFALRAGYFYEHPYNGAREFMTFGAGIRYNIVGVDFSYIYALEENHPLANTLRFSLLLEFSQ